MHERHNPNLSDVSKLPSGGYSLDTDLKLKLLTGQSVYDDGYEMLIVAYTCRYTYFTPAVRWPSTGVLRSMDSENLKNRSHPCRPTVGPFELGTKLLLNGATIWASVYDT